MIFLLSVTVSSMLLAAIMSAIAWRMASQERRRSEARVAALAAAIHAPAVEVDTAPRFALARSGGGLRIENGARPEPLRPSFQAARPAPRWDPDLMVRPEERSAPGADMFASSPSAASGPRFGAMAAVAALVIGGVVLGAALSTRRLTTAGGSANHQATSLPAATPEAGAPALAHAAAPLELTALGHERDGERITVRGIVRNPRSGEAVERLTAVVFLFDADGGFLTSGRAAIEPSALGPGDESTFTVTIPGADNVGRYRVSFRTDQRVVPHVDRREPSNRS